MAVGKRIANMIVGVIIVFVIDYKVLSTLHLIRFLNQVERVRVLVL